MDIVGGIIAYEQGELGVQKTIELFSSLVKSGEAWQLQGHYGRTAKNLIDNGFIDSSGQINQDKIDDLIDS